MYDSVERAFILLEMLKYADAVKGLLAILYEREDPHDGLGFLFSVLSERVLHVAEGSDFAAKIEELLWKNSVSVLPDHRQKRCRMVKKYHTCILDLVAFSEDSGHRFTKIGHVASKPEIDFLDGLGLSAFLKCRISTFRVQIGDGPVQWFDEEEFAYLLWSLLKCAALQPRDYPSWLRCALAVVGAKESLWVLAGFHYWEGVPLRQLQAVVDVGAYFAVVLNEEYLKKIPIPLPVLHTNATHFEASGVCKASILTSRARSHLPSRAKTAEAPELRTAEVLPLQKDVLIFRFFEKFRLLTMNVDRMVNGHHGIPLAEMMEYMYSNCDTAPDIKKLKQHGVQRLKQSYNVVSISAAVYCHCVALVQKNSSFWTRVEAVKVYFVVRAALYGDIPLDAGVVESLVCSYLAPDLVKPVAQMIIQAKYCNMSGFFPCRKFFSKLPVVLRDITSMANSRNLLAPLHQMDYRNFENLYRCLTRHEGVERSPVSLLVNPDDLCIADSSTWKSEFTVFLFSHVEATPLQLFEGLRFVYRQGLRLSLMSEAVQRLNVLQEEDWILQHMCDKVFFGAVGFVTFLVFRKDALAMYHKLLLPILLDDSRVMVQRCREILLGGNTTMIRLCVHLFLHAIFEYRPNTPTRIKDDKFKPLTKRAQRLNTSSVGESSNRNVKRIQHMFIWILFKWKDDPDLLWQDMIDPLVDGTVVRPSRGVQTPNLYSALLAFFSLDQIHYVGVEALREALRFLSSVKEKATFWDVHWHAFRKMMMRVCPRTTALHVTVSELYYLYSFCAFPFTPAARARHLFLHVTLNRSHSWMPHLRCAPTVPIPHDAYPSPPVLVRASFHPFVPYDLHRFAAPMLNHGMDYSDGHPLSGFNEFVLSRGFDPFCQYFFCIMELYAPKKLTKSKLQMPKDRNLAFPVGVLGVLADPREQELRESCDQCMVETILTYPISFLRKREYG